ncbi:MAG: SGNH/GDSL hydrolase family protein [Puia sp.]|nr:SGNH/GDSL hydrolase family protein [Puia sp.]
MRLLHLFLLICLIPAGRLSAQGYKDYRWWDPAANAFPVIEGQGWPKEVKNPYDRLPARAEQTVRPAVWNLSRNTAGLYIKFRTNTPDIVVRYKVDGAQAMPHMPATGVSGVDLYAIDIDGNWVWAPGKYSFGDTIEYHFSNLKPVAGSGRDCEYRLFLPLYNSVSWLRVGIPAGNSLHPIPLQPEKPVVVYGTSIAQGGCATRPGLAWTALLERKLDLPLLNLGFSGNGKLETPVVDLLTEIDAGIYVLDCLPNMTPGGDLSAEEVERRLVAAIKEIQAKRPGTPILLVEHSGSGTDRIIDTSHYNHFEAVNNISRKVFARLTAEGVKDIYSLSTKEIGFDIEATVDGVHPNDWGMMLYANAYEKKIRAILKQETGSLSTEMPVMQTRDGYDWRARHDSILLLNRERAPRNCILANSIIHYWGGRPVAHLQWGADSWDRYLEPLGLRNQGYGWDRIENVLWRVYHGELDGYNARYVILMIGTNNLGTNSDTEIVAGLRRLIGAIQYRQPAASILVSGIFPRRGMEGRIVKLNRQIEALALSGTGGKSGITGQAGGAGMPDTGGRTVYIDPGLIFLNGHGKIDEGLFSDGLHPNADGYRKLAPVLAGYLKD